MTKRQKAVVSAILDISSRGRYVFTLDEMYLRVYGQRRPTLKHPRTGLAGALRAVGYNASKEGLLLRRTSKLGAGEKAHYIFAGDFNKLLH